MQGPERGPKPGAAHIELAQHSPEQHGGQRVAGERDQMIAERLHAPKRVLQPEICQNEGKVIRGSCSPDFAETKRADDGGISGDVKIVVPEEFTGQYTEVRQNHRRHEGETPKQGTIRDDRANRRGGDRRGHAR